VKNTQKNMKTSPHIRGLDLYSKNGIFHLIYSLPGKKEYFFRLKESKNGSSFSDIKKHLQIHTSFLRHCEDSLHVDELATTKLAENRYFMTYTKKDHNLRTHLYGATSHKGMQWEKKSLITGANSFGMVVPEYLFEKHHILYFGHSSIKIATSANLDTWHIMPDAILKPRKNRFDYSALSVARVLNVGEHIALFYLAKNAHKKLCLGVVLLDKKAPGRIIWRSAHPLWQQPIDWITNKIKVLGIIQTQDAFVAYFEHGRGEVFSEKLSYDIEAKEISPKKRVTKVPLSKTIKKARETKPLTRSIKNPIIEPNRENAWEAMATFNPAALYLNDKVHLIYRAQGFDNISVFGYAGSSDGIHIDDRSEQPVYFMNQDFKKNKHPFPCISGGGWGGCEDPRLTQIEDKIYMIYISFNGYAPPGVALTSITTENFLNKVWEWDAPRLISRPGQIQKNWVIFPEKINGHYAVLHSISPKISIDYVASLDDESILIDSYHTKQHYTDKTQWDNIVRGVGATPLKTDHGWLVLYHAMDQRDPNRYKVGAMLLDHADPEKILARCIEPILEPDEHYENEGLKSGVVYVCGAVIKDETLFVYYGGADTTVAVATAPLKEFLDQLITSGKVTMTTMKKRTAQ